MDEFYAKYEGLIAMGYLLDIVSKDDLKKLLDELNDIRKDELKLLERKLKFVEKTKDICSK